MLVHQRIDRCYRIGQHHQVTAWYSLAPSMIDDDMYVCIKQQHVVIDAATQGNTQTKDVSVLDEIVARLRHRAA